RAGLDRLRRAAAAAAAKPAALTNRRRIRRKVPDDSVDASLLCAVHRSEYAARHVRDGDLHVPGCRTLQVIVHERASRCVLADKDFLSPDLLAVLLIVEPRDRWS